MNDYKFLQINLKSIDDLKYVFKLSADLDENNIINFAINNDGFQGIAKNATDSCYKLWKLPFDGDNIKIVVGDLESNTLQCSVYKGKEFISKILKHFDKTEHTIKLTFYYEDFIYAVKAIKLEIVNEKNKSLLSFNITGANTAVYYDTFDNDLIEMLFDNNFSSIKLNYEFELSEDEIKQLKGLCEFVSNDELQKDYLSLKISNDGELTITDDLFKRTYEDKEVNIINKVTDVSLDLSKSLFNTISKNTQKVYVKQFEDSNYLLTFKSDNDIEEKTTFLLLKQIDMSQNYEDIFNDDSTFEN